MSQFDRMYEGSPPWEIGRAQPVVERLLAEGGFSGEVLDVGCGTGENSIVLARHGLAVTGVDIAPRAIAIARVKSTQRRARARFLELDALELETLERRFDTILDCALFHVFTDEARVDYVTALESVSRAGTTLQLICFSEREPDWGGPRRVSEAELRAAFARRWVVERIEPVRYQHTGSSEGAAAHLATIVYAGGARGALA